MESKNTCVEVFGKRLKELRKANGYTIEQFAEAVGISKSTVGYYENNNRMPDIEILLRITNVLNVSADYLIGKTNTTAMCGKMKTVCDFTGLSDTAADYLVQLVKNKDYGKLSVVNHLFDELAEDYAFYAYENENGEEVAESVLGALFQYFDKVALAQDEWAEIIDTGDENKDEILKAAYMQMLLNQVTENVRSSAEVFRQENEPNDVV